MNCCEQAGNRASVGKGPAKGWAHAICMVGTQGISERLNEVDDVIEPDSAFRVSECHDRRRE